MSPLNHPRMLRAISLLFLFLVVTGVVIGLVTRTTSTAAPPPSAVPLSGELTGPAPWPANTRDLLERLFELGLPALAREGTRYHIHAHLDVLVNGKRVVVPAGIGIDPKGRFISPLHTHDASGVIHVESPEVRAFTLGQFLGVWGVRFGGDCLGGYCAGQGRSLRGYVDGRPVDDPARFPLAAHQEIVVAFGSPRELPRPVPDRYAFPPGE